MARVARGAAQALHQAADGESLLVKTLLGDPSKAKEKLGWTPKTTFAELVVEMVREDFKAAERDELVKKHGFRTMDHHE